MTGPEDDINTTIDLRRDTKPDAEAQVDPSVHTLGAIFGHASFPPDMPEEVKAAILERAEQERLLAGDMILAPAVNAMSPQARSEKDEKEREEFIADIRQAMAQQELERQHEAEWLASSHTYAGQTLSGEDWKKMMHWFADDANIAAWEEAMMAETGQSREEVRRTGGKMQRFYELMDRQAKGTLTKEERAEFDRLNNDREVKRGTEVQAEIQGLRHSQSAELSGRNDATWDGGQRENATSFASTLADDPSVGIAPPMSDSYRLAANGVPKPAPQPSVSPSLPPAQVVQVSADNMFG
ncbi:hypothetical protein OOT33_00090 [Sphingobium sp. DEHP117]|uniref:hypothetical protein n=1 Tax=Sphingobium sp. DEHP117 TaxID=2993436 RepID=UPI0027D582C2|nr:hypothetical protein [Sphingobium sp. DEHP117]MDQ4418846.1 hypothetical protein [Sphingobium sp. DEHP117]